MGIVQDFKAFALKGNVVDLAVGVVTGGAFGKIVTSLVNDLIMPLLALITGGVNFKDMKLILREAVTHADGSVLEAVTLNYGNFIQHSVDFFLVALSIFMVIQVMSRLRRLKAQEAQESSESQPSAPSEIELLSEIRDFLKAKAL